MKIFLETLKMVKEIYKEKKELSKYKTQLVQSDFNVEAIEYMIQRTQVKNVEIEIQMNNGNKLTIRPFNRTGNIPFETFEEKYQKRKM